jgi:hypothetical protein
MKISEYIDFLEKIKEEHGDLECQTYDHYAGRIEADAPEMCYALLLTGRRKKNSFFHRLIDEEECRGGKVCRI